MGPFEEVQELGQRLLLDARQFAAVSERLSAIACESPGDAWLLVEIGGVFDAAGFEIQACHWYERGLALGEENFPVERRCEFYIWYGSTLRNVGRLSDSERVLRHALGRWPQSSALQFFLALTLKSQGRSNETIALLTALHLGIWDDSLRRYERAVQSYWSLELKRDADRPGLSWIRLCVEDVGATTGWYTQVLEVEPKVYDDRFSLFYLGSGRIELVQADAKNPTSPGGSVGYLHVSDLQAWITRFKKAGAQVYRGPLPIPEEGITICQMIEPHGSVLGLVGPGTIDEA